MDSQIWLSDITIVVNVYVVARPVLPPMFTLSVGNSEGLID